MLAKLVQSSSHQQLFIQPLAPGMPQESILIEIEGENPERHTGVEAWDYLLKEHPYLKSLSWLAAKIGLETHIPQLMMSSANRLKKLFCRC